METGNIIAVYNDDKRIALNEFDALMRKTNDYMNKIATLSDRFRGCDAKQLEKETLAAIREQCTNTSFILPTLSWSPDSVFPTLWRASISVWR